MTNALSMIIGCFVLWFVFAWFTVLPFLGMLWLVGALG